MVRVRPSERRRAAAFGLNPRSAITSNTRRLVPLFTIPLPFRARDTVATLTRDGVQSAKLFFSELPADRTKILVELSRTPRSNAYSRHCRLMQQPVQRDLGGGPACLAGNTLDCIQDVPINFRRTPTPVLLPIGLRSRQP